MEVLPLLKKRELTERLTIPVDKEMKEEISRIKYERGIDMTAWARQILKRELIILKQDL